MKESKNVEVKTTPNSETKTPSQLIDERILELNDWRGQLLSEVRVLLKRIAPEVIEEWKWRGTPVWYVEGMLFTGETYKNAVKLTFAKGAAIQDNYHLFNASLEGNARRAIDFHEGDQINTEALSDLIKEVITLNHNSKQKK